MGPWFHPCKAVRGSHRKTVFAGGQQPETRTCLDAVAGLLNAAAPVEMQEVTVEEAAEDAAEAGFLPEKQDSVKSGGLQSSGGSGSFSKVHKMVVLHENFA